MKAGRHHPLGAGRTGQLPGQVKRPNCVQPLRQAIADGRSVPNRLRQRRTVRQGPRIYEQRPDKTWSLTDCISFVVMNQEGIHQAMTADHHFEQAGFSILLTI